MFPELRNKIAPVGGVEAPERWRPSAEPALRRLRAEVYRSVREFFDRRGVLEVETPILSRYANTDPHIESLTVRVAGCQHYLRTSAEFPMKRLLAADGQAIYELGRVFRADESGAQHSVEFTMLEWYRPGMNQHELMDEVMALVHSLFARFAQPLRAATKMTYTQAMREYCHIDPLTASDDELKRWLHRGAHLSDHWSRSQCLDFIFSAGVGPCLPSGQANLIYNFPAEQAALARINGDDPRVAHRFELLLGSMELANGYDELCDGAELAARLTEENRQRSLRGQNVVPRDDMLIQALHCGLPPCAGVALGMDRLLMALHKAEKIDQVLNFAPDRA